MSRETNYALKFRDEIKKKSTTRKGCEFPSFSLRCACGKERLDSIVNRIKLDFRTI